MKKLFTSVFVILLTASCSNHQESTNKNIETIHVAKEDITVVINNQIFPWKIKKDEFSFAYNGNPNEVGFIAGTDTLNFKVFPSDTIVFNFILNNIDTVEVKAIGRPNPASFDNKYIEENTDRYLVFSPEVHELINISTALTKVGRLDSNMVYMKSTYYDSVISHFETYANHPLIDSLNQHITEAFSNTTYDYYLNLRMNACMYSFDDDKIVNNSPYIRLASERENKLQELISLYEDFAEKSGFKTFYKKNTKYYQSLIDDYYKLVPIDKMWKWIEKKFPQRYESYKIYFSPLINGIHSTQNLSDNGFKETIMFINAPIFIKNFSKKDKEAILSRIVFTEIDHNYVNPTTDGFLETQTVMKPLTCWNNGTQGYGNSKATFNEYMTWAVFTLYLYDNFDNEVFERRNIIESDYMVNVRGFLKYNEFNDFVLNWYMKNSEKPLEDLYPEVIKWIGDSNCKTTPING